MLNNQLADEESSLAILQGCIEAIERKNAAIVSERGRDKSNLPPYESFRAKLIKTQHGKVKSAECIATQEAGNYYEGASGDLKLFIF